MPVLDRQAVAPPAGASARSATLPPSLQGLPPRSVPEMAPTPLQHHYVLLSVPVLIAGTIAITALELGVSPVSPLVKLCVLVGAPLLVADDRGRRRPDLAIGLGVDARRSWQGPVPARLGGRQHRRSGGAHRGRAAHPAGVVSRGRDPVTDGRVPARSRRPVVRPALGPWRPAAGWRPRSTSAPAVARRWLRADPGRGSRSARAAAPAATSPTSIRASWSRPCRSPTRARSCSSAAASSRARARGPSRAASSRSTRRSTRRPSARRWEETGLIVEPGEIVGLYTRLEASVVTIAFEARIVGGTAAPTPEATEVVAFPPEAIPWAGIAFKTTLWALHDWLGPAPARTSSRRLRFSSGR